MRLKAKIGIYFLIFLPFFTQQALAQLRQLGVDRSTPVSKRKNIQAKVQVTPLLLPFWDDFSSSSIDTTKWINQGANISFGAAIDAPSIGVAVLDGTKSNGQPYSTDITLSGPSDQLTSQVIDLGGLEEHERTSTYFSFFWQAGGKAELPDEADKLALLFLDSLGNWNTAWEQYGGVEIQDFQQEILPLAPIYFHSDFQFKFQNSGRFSGPFDTWLVDYIFLNSGRNPSDLNYQDRALTQANSNFFGKYNTIPLFELNADPTPLLTGIHNQFNNLNDRFRAMEYSILLREKESKALIMSLNANTPFNPVPLANERRDFSSASPTTWNMEEREVAFDMESLVYLSSGDNYLIDEIQDNDTTYHESVDFRINDSIKTTISIQDYYAYDRGTVDYAAGINQRSGMLAVRFESSETAYINAISINFTNAAQSGTAVDLMIWSDPEEPAKFTKEVLIQAKTSLETFTKFELDTAIQVDGVFYVGFMQFTNEFVHIGLDKSNDSSEEVFYNTNGTWQGNTEVKGSLMIRPHLQIDPPEVGEDTQPGSRIEAYPNPATQNRVNIKGEFDLVKMYDAFGREINISVAPSENGKIINFVSKQEGVYFIKAWKGNTTQTIRILVK
ncbi:T9SS type A sorting domain-containing protein [Echinicola marina]|uniref:T9SS type A sorting domain-containing protein n=1 Tax=Echinicola marina TaxID=2859768 RepID=UPI001CF641D5|nr:T9SS type A sorting domain-containing protein [Echinicola marina]UCS92345.1 T9SS type A sorting domain-containing protein [Echinicola marina]